MSFKICLFTDYYSTKLFKFSIGSTSKWIPNSKSDQIQSDKLLPETDMSHSTCTCHGESECDVFLRKKKYKDFHCERFRYVVRRS